MVENRDDVFKIHPRSSLASPYSLDIPITKDFEDVGEVHCRPIYVTWTEDFFFKIASGEVKPTVFNECSPDRSWWLSGPQAIHLRRGVESRIDRFQTMPLARMIGAYT